MGNSISASDEVKLRARIQLLNSHLRKKTSVRFQINDVKIKMMYKQLNANSKMIKEIHNIQKLAGKKIFEAISEKSKVRNFKKKAKPPVDVEEISKRSLSKLSENSFNIIEEEIERNKALQGKLKTLKTMLENKRKIFNENKAKIDSNRKTASLLKTTQKKVEKKSVRSNSFKKSDDSTNISNGSLRKFTFSVISCADLEPIREKSISQMEKRKELFNSLKNAKNSLVLSDNALKLWSKFMLKEELGKKLKMLSMHIAEEMNVSIENKTILKRSQSDEYDLLNHLKFEILLLENEMVLENIEKNYAINTPFGKNEYSRESSQSTNDLYEGGYQLREFFCENLDEKDSGDLIGHQRMVSKL